jgi:transposase
MHPETAHPDPIRKETDDEATTCPRCGESHDLAKVKGCLKCLKCGFKFDCNGW